mmetsp:Transcript_30076/g.63438  ORF Transcript_30076/g.63438 Transcript_30076/m.63438 type:complete len:96 (-) Transcript_30076:113-400(-)
MGRRLLTFALQCCTQTSEWWLGTVGRSLFFSRVVFSGSFRCRSDVIGNYRIPLFHIIALSSAAATSHSNKPLLEFLTMPRQKNVPIHTEVHHGVR